MMLSLLKRPHLTVNNPLVATLLYGISIVFMKGLSLLMLPFLTHRLTQVEYGQLEILASIASLASVLAGLGLAEALFRFAGMAKTPKKAAQAFSRLLKIALLMAIAITLVGQTLLTLSSQWLPSALSLLDLRLVLLTVAFEALISLPLGWLRMQNKVVTFCLMVCMRAVMQISLTLVFIHAEYGVTGILVAGLISALVQVVGLLYCVRGALSRQISQLNAKYYLTYSVPIMLSGMVAFFIMGADKWILAHYASLTDVAIVAVAAKLALATVILLQPYSMWWSPKRFQVYQQQGEKQLTYYTQLGLLFTLSIGLLLCFLSPLLIALLVPESYQSARYIAPILIGAMVFKEITELVNIGCFVGKTSHSQVIINAIAAVITLILLFILIPKMQSLGLAYALCLGQGCRLILFFIVSQHYLPLAYPLFKIAFLIVLAFSTSYLLPLMLPRWHAACLAPVISLVFFILAYGWLFNFNLSQLGKVKHALS